MGKEVHLASGTLVLLLISFANLCLVALAVLYRTRKPAPRSEQLPRTTTWLGSLGLGLAFTSQVLYLAFTAAFVTALLGTGPKRRAGVLSSVITVGLWLLSAVASVAV